MKPQDILFWIAMVLVVGGIIIYIDRMEQNFVREMLDAGYCQNIRDWKRCNQ